MTKIAAFVLVIAILRLLGRAGAYVCANSGTVVHIYACVNSRADSRANSRTHAHTGCAGDILGGERGRRQCGRRADRRR